MNRKPLTAAMASDRLMSLCNRAEYCRWELDRKLIGWGIPAAERNAILERLEEDRLVDDARYARAFAYTHIVHSHWGRMKVRLHLMNKHIEKQDIDAALNEVDEDIYEKIALDVLGAKKRELGNDADSYDGRTRLFRYACLKGFEPGLVSRLIKSGEY